MNWQGNQAGEGIEFALLRAIRLGLTLTIICRPY